MAKTLKDMFARTIEAWANQDRNLWTISRALFDELQPGEGRKNINQSDYDVLASAFAEAGVAPMPYNTARAYRATAEYWPVADVIDGLSFSNHRVLKDVGNLKASKRIVEDLLSKTDSKGKPIYASAAAIRKTDLEAAVRSVTNPGKSATTKSSKSGKVTTISVAAVTKLLEALTVADHFAPLDVATLETFASLLRKTADRVDRHANHRRKSGKVTGRKSGNTAAKPTKSTKSTGKAPAQVR